MFINLSRQASVHPRSGSSSSSQRLSTSLPRAFERLHLPFINSNEDPKQPFAPALDTLSSSSRLCVEGRGGKAALLSSQHTMNHHHCLHYLFRRSSTFLFLFSPAFCDHKRSKTSRTRKKILPRKSFKLREKRRRKVFSFSKNDNFLPLRGESEN